MKTYNVERVIPGSRAIIRGEFRDLPIDERVGLTGLVNGTGTVQTRGNAGNVVVTID